MTVTITWADENISSEGETNVVNFSFRRLQFDAVERLARSSTAEVTQFAVESGAPLTDHKKKLPRKIVVVGKVSNTPIRTPPPSGKTIESTMLAVVGAGLGGNVLQFSEEFDRVQDVYDSLQELVESPIFVTLETDIDVFERVTVISVENIKTTSDNMAEFSVTFQEIFIGVTEIVEIPIPRQPRGSQQEESASSIQTDVVELPESWALNIGQGVGLFD